jgi:hypothetical protein
MFTVTPQNLELVIYLEYIFLGVYVLSKLFDRLEVGDY